ncbi:hypothetical protein DL93DRAFT_1376337 [Clavulina sp. PMI_390]|nr:hypothetical protein DL93DRAFT_1376337 [Clavulina sp. PMI_390]
MVSFVDGVDDAVNRLVYDPLNNSSYFIGRGKALDLISQATGDYDTSYKPRSTFRDLGLRQVVKDQLREIIPSILLPGSDENDAHAKSTHPTETTLGYVSPSPTWKPIGREFGRSRCYILAVFAEQTLHEHAPQCGLNPPIAQSLVLVDLSPNEESFRRKFRATYKTEPRERVYMLQPADFVDCCEKVSTSNYFYHFSCRTSPGAALCLNA